MDHTFEADLGFLPKIIVSSSTTTEETFPCGPWLWAFVLRKALTCSMYALTIEVIYLLVDSGDCCVDCEGRCRWYLLFQVQAKCDRKLMMAAQNLTRGGTSLIILKQPVEHSTTSTPAAWLDKLEFREVINVSNGQKLPREIRKRYIMPIFHLQYIRPL